MDQALSKRILATYGINNGNVEMPRKGYRNASYAVTLPGNVKLNLILYKNEPGIVERVKRANAVGDYLAENGFPARGTYDKRIVELKNGDVIRYVALYDYLPGTTIPWEAYTKHHIKLLGMAMSHMHSQLKPFTPFTYSVSNEYLAIVARMRRYFGRDDVRSAMEKKLSLTVDDEALEQLEQLLKLAAHLPMQQPLHMDFVRGNVLFDENTTSPFVIGDVKLTGIIDFEKTAIGHPVFDIARTLAFLLVDCSQKSEAKVRKYFLVSGYNKRGLSTYHHVVLRRQDQTFNVLEKLIDLFLLHDLYKFLRHNPYEDLHLNHHFVRSRDILRTRKVLK